MSSHIKTALKWGAIGGVIMMILRTVVYVISPLSLMSNGIQNAIYLPLIFCMVWGCVTAKRDMGGNMLFGKAFVVAFVIGMFASVIYDVYSTILFAWIDPELGARITRIIMEKSEEAWEQQGLTDSQMEQQRRILAWIFKWFLAIVLVTQVIISVILSLIIAAFVRQKDEIEPLQDISDSTPSV